VFLAGCFVFTFLALMEFSAASYMERRRSLNQKRLSVMPNAEHILSELSRASLRKQATATPPRMRKLTTVVTAELKDTLGWKPSAVDLYSRYVFPGAFVLFQLIYWITCLLSVPVLPSDAVILNRVEY
jgi:hypothetical protein